MGTIWAFVLIVLGGLAWGGQTLTWASPSTAARLGLAEREDSVEPVFWADVRGESRWDFFTLWTLVVAGVLLMFDHEAWPYFALVGGGIYVYFAGRGLLTRLEIRRHGYRIGEPNNVRMALAMLAIWGVVGLVTIVAAYNALAGG